MKAKRILPLAVLVLLAIPLLYAFPPRSFVQLMGADFSPEKVERVDVQLHAVGSQSRSFRLSPEDPQCQALLELLTERSYFLLLGSPPYQEIILGYQVDLSFLYNDCLWCSISFCGDPDITFSSAAGIHHVRTSGGSDFQKELLTLLLARDKPPC